MKNDLPSKIKRGKPTFIRIKANKKEMKYNNDNVRRQDRLLEEDRAYALLRDSCKQLRRITKNKTFLSCTNKGL